MYSFCHLCIDCLKDCFIGDAVDGGSLLSLKQTSHGGKLATDVNANHLFGG